MAKSKKKDRPTQTDIQKEVAAAYDEGSFKPSARDKHPDAEQWGWRFTSDGEPQGNDYY